MSIAAVPNYLGQNFTEASPGLRFGMLLPIWTTRQDQEADVKERAQKKSNEGYAVQALLEHEGMDVAIQQLCKKERKPLPGLWDKNDFAAKKVWNSIKALNGPDRERMSALAQRQTALASTIPDHALLHLDALAVAPFTTGLGNEHPLENGFAFLNPYGLPYLPGSGVKGVLRQAASELIGGEWGNPQGWDQATIDALFGKEDSNAPQRGALSFWDVVPQIQGERLSVDIMTPHQSHYYQWKKDRAGNEIEVSPHDSGQPVPISFLTLPPGTAFHFYVTCDLPFLGRLNEPLINSWKTLLAAAFQHAFDWLGFGAKTAVGYGAMEENPQVTAAKERQQEEQRRAALPADERFLTELDEKLNALAKDPRTGKTRILPSSDSTWPGMLHLVDTHLEALGGLAKVQREQLASQIKQRLVSAYRIEGKAEKALKEKLALVRG